MAHEQPGGKPARRVGRIGKELVDGDRALERLPPLTHRRARQCRRKPCEENGIHPAERQPEPNRGLGPAEVVPCQPQPVAQHGLRRPVGLGLDRAADGSPVIALLEEPTGVSARMGVVEPQGPCRRRERLP